MTMRAVECPCGEYLKGRNDGDLLEVLKRHANADHEGKYSEAELKLLVNTAAYDASDE